MSPPHLLDLPPELLEHILVLLYHENARSLQAIRESSSTLRALIAHSKLLQYLERIALQGTYDPSAAFTFTSAQTLAPALPERAAALRAWEEAWGALEGEFWRGRKPDLFILRPPTMWSLPSSRDRVRQLTATIVDPEPLSSSSAMGPMEEDGRYGVLDEQDHFSFGPWFVTATRDGINVRASYSYFDLHGCLGRVEGEGGPLGGGNGDRDGIPGIHYDYDRWTVIKVPVWNVMAFALSTELDLAMVISIAKVEYEEQEQEQEEWERKTRTHLAVRPLRFRDGTPHPCAKVPTMRFSVMSAPAFYMVQAQVLGDYLLLWFGPGDENYSVSKLYLIAWKQGSITLLRENPAGKYGAVPAMISKDILAQVQVDPPGIELCRILDMQKEAEEGGEGEGGGGGSDDDGGATNDRGSRNNGPPRMDKLCTLLLPPLRKRDGIPPGRSARINWASCVGEHPGHHTFSRGPWPEYRSAPQGRPRAFRQSTKDSIVSVVMEIVGCEGRLRTFEVVVRCATLLAYADAAAAASARVPESSNGDGDGRSAQDVVVGDAEGVEWEAWGPRATAMSDHTHVGWRYMLGERRATIEHGVHQIRIRDYNPYRIRQAKASLVAKGLGGHGGHGLGEEDSHEEEEGKGNADRARTNGSRRITEGSRTIEGGEWFEEDVSTALPHMDSVVDVPGCRAFYMEQDQIMLPVDDLSKVIGSNGCQWDGFVLYRM